MCVYSPNRTQEQIKHYMHVKSTLQKYMNISGHVILSGDFNCIYNPELDNLGGALHPYIEIANFQNLIESTDLFDVWRFHHNKDENGSP